jgi:hypothetical protein
LLPLLLLLLLLLPPVVSADLQMVNMSLRLLSKPNEDKLPTIFKVSGGQ